MAKHLFEGKAKREESEAIVGIDCKGYEISGMLWFSKSAPETIAQHMHALWVPLFYYIQRNIKTTNKKLTFTLRRNLPSSKSSDAINISEG